MPTTGKVAWQTTTVDQNQPYTITGAPRIAKGKIIIGNGGAEYGVRGYVSAYDAETGKLAWRFYTVPGDPSKPQENKALERALPTWKGNDWWKYGGGGTVWDSIVYDPELNLLYVGTGNGSTWNRHVRSPGGGDNLYLASILAINPDNGELVWHYQTTPGDTWDYTAVQPMMLADLQIGGRQRKVIMQAPKNGFFYVIDRATGELLSADKYVEVNWASHVDMKTGRPVEIPAPTTRTRAPTFARARSAATTGRRCRSARRPASSTCPRRITAATTSSRKTVAEFKQMQGDPVKAPLPYNLGLGSIERNAEKYTRCRTRAACSRGIRSRASRGGPSSTARTGTAARSRPPATSCSRAPRPATSSPTTRPPARSSGRRGRRPASSRRRSPIRSTASNTCR